MPSQEVRKSEGDENMLVSLCPRDSAPGSSLAEAARRRYFLLLKVFLEDGIVE